MKKNMQFLTVVLASLLILISFISGAQTLPSGGGSGGGSAISQIPIDDIRGADSLRNAALRSVTHGSRSVYSKSMDWDYVDRFTYTNDVTGAGAEEVLNKLFNLTFMYRLTNPDDKIQGYVYLYDVNENLIFFGYAEYTSAEVSGKEKPQYNIWMQNAPILSNVESAEVLALAEDGTTANRYPLKVQNGQIMFAYWMAGAPNGLLAVKFKDGTVATYQLDDPDRQTPGITKEGRSQWKIEGHYVCNFNPNQKGGAPEPVVKIIETWLRPTVYLEVGTNQLVTFDVLGLVQNKGITTFERPLSLSYSQEDGPWAGQAKIVNPQITFPAAGKYRIMFDWVDFGKPNMLYTGPMDGGKG